MASFSDDFNRANNTDLGAGWVEVSGDWSIVSNQLSPGAAGGTIILRAAGSMSSSDHSAQVTIAATTAASQGVWCRGNSNITSGYLWRNNGTSWDLFSVIGGSFTVIGTYTAAAAPGDVAKVQAVGSLIKAFVNGVERVSVVNTGVAAGTSVGIRADSTGALRFDDFTAADVTAGANLSVASADEASQPLTAAKASTLTPATSTQAAQPVGGAKTGTLATAPALASAQGLTGVKQAALGFAVEAATALSIPGAILPRLGIAAGVETAMPLIGVKSAAATRAAETGTSVQLAGSAGGRLDSLTAETPRRRWEAGAAATRWPSSGRPRT